MKTTISLNKVEFYAYHGYYSTERKMGNKFILDIDLDIKSFDDLKEVRIGAIRGNFYSPRFTTLDTKELTLVGKTDQLIGMLELGRIDVAVTSESHSIELFEAKFEKASFEDSTFNPLYISIPKKSKAIKFYDDIAALTLEYRKNGAINQYFERYELSIPDQVIE